MRARLKLRIAENGPTVATVCVIAALLLFAGAWQVYTNPEVEQPPEEEVDNFDIELSLEESAVVESENPLYDTGERIERPAYFTNITPELTLSPTIRANDDREIRIEQELVLSQTATRDDSELWSDEEVLDTNEETISDGREQSNITLDVNELAENQEDITSIISSVSEIETELRLETRYETEPVEGESYTGQLSVTVTPASTGNAYWLEGSRTDSDSETRVQQPDPIEQPPNYGQVFILVIGGLGMLVLSGVVVQKSQAFDPDELRIEMYNEQYSEWISEGELVVDPERQYVYVNSLGDLVDIGIDADKRVIYDRELRAYVVVDDDIIYYFAREPTNIELWANVGGATDRDQR
ncbi:MAG: DUF5305 family protein [Halohasta sp.]